MGEYVERIRVQESNTLLTGMKELRASTAEVSFRGFDRWGRPMANELALSLIEHHRAGLVAFDADKVVNGWRSSGRRLADNRRERAA